MVNFKLYERLLELPLFQGMSRSDLEEAVSSIRYRNLSFSKNKIIVGESDVCDKLYFLVSGSVSAIGYADDKGYTITETLFAPDILQPERIFGLTQRFTRTFKAMGECSFICISKPNTMALSDKYEIFRLNLLNIICTKSQRITRYPWKTKPQNIRHKIARFIEMRCLRPAGEKTVRIKMERLSDEINESRLNVSRELNAMHEEGLITLRRGEIHVMALEKMTSQGR